MSTEMLRINVKQKREKRKLFGVEYHFSNIRGYEKFGTVRQKKKKALIKSMYFFLVFLKINAVTVSEQVCNKTC